MKRKETTTDVQIRLNSRLWLLVVFSLLLLEIVFPYRGWLILLTGTGLTWLIGLYWARNMARHLHLIREVRYGWAQVGDLLEERFALENSGWLPVLWVEVMDHSTIPDYHVSLATGVSGQSSNSWLTRQVCSRRGQYTLGPTTLITGDPFGIYTVTIRDPACAEILVTPPILPFPAITIAKNGRVDEGNLSRKIKESSPVPAGVREYQPGDSLQRIHWPTSARREVPFIKQFTDLPSGDWWILLDLDRKVQAGEGARSTEEAAVILAASIADRGLRSGYPVGLISNSQEVTWLPPRRGSEQRWELLRALAKVTPGEHSLAELLESAYPVMKSWASLIVISASTQPDWVVSLIRHDPRGVVPTVLLLDVEKFGGISEGSGVTGVERDLASLEIPCFVIGPESVAQTDQFASPENRWEWRTLPTGKAVAVHQPPDTSWKPLQ